jgi:hypothetical protein
MRRPPTHARRPVQVQSTERRPLTNGNAALKPDVTAGAQRKEAMRGTSVATASDALLWITPRQAVADLGVGVDSPHVASGPQIGDAIGLVLRLDRRQTPSPGARAVPDPALHNRWRPLQNRRAIARRKRLSATS